MFFVWLFFVFACSDSSVGSSSDTSKVEQNYCATLVDQTICDFQAIDSLGEIANLSDLYGQPIVLDLSAMWCGPCKTAGQNTQAAADSLENVTFLTVLIENEYGSAPTDSDLQRWEDSYDITSAPVWGSSRDIITSNPIELENHLFLEGWPTFYFIDSQGHLKQYLRGYDTNTIMQIASELE